MDFKKYLYYNNICLKILIKNFGPCNFFFLVNRRGNPRCLASARKSTPGINHTHLVPCNMMVQKNFISGITNLKLSSVSKKCVGRVISVNPRCNTFLFLACQYTSGTITKTQRVSLSLSLPKSKRLFLTEY